MIKVYSLDERLYFTPLCLSRFGHAAGDRGRVALDAADKGMGKWMSFRAGLRGLDDDDLKERDVSTLSRTC